MKQFSRNRRFRRREAAVDLPLTPLIDTAFTLLIIFMVTAPMMQNSLKINLPKSSNQANQASQLQERISISIGADGSLMLGNQVVKSDQLTQKLQAALANLSDKTVVIRADKSLVYDRVIQIIDQISNVEGVQNVALAAEVAPRKV